MRFHILFLLIAFPTLTFAQTTQPAETRGPVPDINHVLIISVDGLRPDVLLRGNTPNMHQLFLHGAFTFWAKTTPQSITLPSHVSMLTGVTPEAHAILWNADLPFAKPVYPSVPTLFELAKRAGLSTGMSAGKHKFDVFEKPGAIDWEFLASDKSLVNADGSPAADADAQVAEHAVEIISSHKPSVMFVHFPDVDAWGHYSGWGSTEQLKAAAEADRCIGLLQDAESKAGLTDSTLDILTADHGGAGRTHGPDDARSRTIPWILSGPHVRQNFDLTLLQRNNDIQTYDTFATACAVLGIHWPVSDPVIGRFIADAFDNQQLLLNTYRPSMSPTTDPTLVSEKPHALSR
ncbi:MAG: alkaline phosphatase family protein [Phycisphaerae bacterium]|nr:alkaline phosphatase family protein [Phycisphaerae bacterium]